MSKDVDSLFIRKLAESGLDLDDAKLLGLEVLSGKQAKTLGLKYAVPGFRIPYFGDDSFYRFRYLRDTRSQFAKLTNAKMVRYVQPAKTTPGVYCPPIGVGEEFPDALRDVNSPLIITEGELKAACACKKGLLTVGLGGVWSFLYKGRPLEWFGKVEWRGRRVFICYDSDSITNVSVNRAETRLCALLGELGAQPYVARLPDVPEVGKTGLDDFLVMRGLPAFEELLEVTTPYEAVAALHSLNGEVVLVMDPGIVVNRKNRVQMGANNFVRVQYADRFHVEESVKADGSITKKKIQTAKSWMEWPGRSKVHSMTYRPGEPEIIDNELNLWRGWGCEPDPAAGIEPWEKLLDYLFNDYPDERQWFEQWCAYPIQHPGSKLATACVLTGVTQGTGKTLIGVTLKQIYGENGAQINETALHNDRNTWAVNKQFIVGDEINGTGRRSSADRLKSMITQKEMRVDQKFIPEYYIPDCVNYYFTSNHPDAFILDEHDRRYFIHEVSRSPLPTGFFDRYDEWLWHGGGPAALFAHLLQVDCSGFNPNGRAPWTDAKKEMVRFSRTDVGAWVANLMDNPDDTLPNGRDLHTARDLLRWQWRCAHQGDWVWEGVETGAGTSAYERQPSEE